MERLVALLPRRRQGGDAPSRSDAGASNGGGRSVKTVLRRVAFHATAVVAALACAALLVNYVIMPAMVRRGDLVAAPDLVGVPLMEAERLAEEAGLGVRVDTDRPHPVLPAGSVSAQTPGAGVEVKRGRTVAVVVSSGQDMRQLPKLAGLNARQAQLDAEHAGFSVSEIVEVHTSHVERGRVVGTYPGAGSVRPAGSGIRMLVSLGPKPAELTMPSLVGRTAEEARLIVEELGLVMRAVRYEGRRGRSGMEVVVVQDPVAGSHVVAGEGVTLRIGN